MSQIRDGLIKAGIQNLKDFGYPDVNKDNIMEAYIFRSFFKGMLEDSLGKNDAIDAEVNKLLAEIEEKDRAAEKTT